MSQQHSTDTQSPNCIFCSIVGSKIPCHKLYEDDHTLSFLDIAPISTAHCLVIPKDHYQTLDQMPPDLAGHCMATVTRISQAIVRATGMTAWNVLQNNGTVAGQEVGHVHFHIIPRAENDGLGYRWLAGKLGTDEAKILACKIADALTGR